MAGEWERHDSDLKHGDHVRLLYEDPAAHLPKPVEPAVLAVVVARLTARKRGAKG